MKKLFRRKLTKSFIEKRFKKLNGGLFDTYRIGYLKDGDSILIEDRIDSICVCRGYDMSSYWIANVEYIYQLRQLLKLYKLNVEYKDKRHD